jgi:hypothetical protein
MNSPLWGKILVKNHEKNFIKPRLGVKYWYALSHFSYNGTF